MVAAVKSSKAFRTIREVADALDLEPHVLRFWEKEFPQHIKPMQRDNGRRYYREADVEKIRTIQSLLHEQGYTIKGAKAVLKGKNVPVESTPVAAASNENTKNPLQPQLKELHQGILQLREKISATFE